MKAFCNRPGCNRIIEGSGRCDRCSKDAETIRRQSGKHKADMRFYSSALWRQLRKTHLDQFPLCVHCEAAGITTAGQHVDHILPRSKRPDLELCADNLQTLCISCHSRKTLTEQI
jgi:5-methylcytosine-specific restriction protein A